MSKVAEYIRTVRYFGSMKHVLQKLEIPHVLMYGSFGRAIEVQANMPAIVVATPLPNNMVRITVKPMRSSSAIDVDPIHEELLIQKLYKLFQALDS